MYLTAEYAPVAQNLMKSRGGLEQTDDISAYINDNTFMPLNLPSPAPSRYTVETYEAKSGETIEFIARKFNVAVPTILWANNLSKSTRLKPGQALKILPVDGVLHTIKKGETLGSISVLYKVYTEDIMEVNGLTFDDLIIAGDVIVIPGGEPLPPPVKRSSFTSTERISVDVKGSLANPAPGAYVSQGLHWRNAVDLANACGSPALAAAGGEISRADTVGWNGGFGKFIMITHAAGFVTVYGHLSNILVEPGQQVAKGQRIGSIGATGHATGCHIHFEVRGAKNPFAG